MLGMQLSAAAKEIVAEPIEAKASSKALSDAVAKAFLTTHDGWSSDEVLLQEALNKRFIAACRTELPDANVGELNWKLLNLRKAGKLKKSKVKPKRRSDNHSEYQHLAEVVARSMQDKHKVSTDHIMCDPKQREAFDKMSLSIAPKVDPYLMRKAAFGLRKARRLKPELVLRIADWDRKITSHRASELAKNLDSIPSTPGIYIFSDQTGYLYVGESLNLRERLTKHLDESDRQSLANYLRKQGIEKTTIEIHAFPSDSRAKRVTVRRAYESELIASRKPRFNVRP